MLKIFFLVAALSIAGLFLGTGGIAAVIAIIVSGVIYENKDKIAAWVQETAMKTDRVAKDTLANNTN